MSNQAQTAAANMFVCWFYLLDFHEVHALKKKLSNWQKLLVSVCLFQMIPAFLDSTVFECHAWRYRSLSHEFSPWSVLCM